MHPAVLGKSRIAAVTVAAVIAASASLAVDAGSGSGSASGAAPAGPEARAPLNANAGPGARAPLAAALDSAGAASAWTPERMRRAEAATLGRGGPAPAPARTSAFGSKPLQNTTAYPNRVHGRLFGSFEPGDGSRVDFTCSATVLSSGSQNLIATAGHCVYDPGFGAFVSDLVFVPGYKQGSTPFGAFEGTHAVTPGQWRLASLDHDLALVQLAPGAGGRELAESVGTRGLQLNPPKRQKILAYGYPASPRPYDGERLVRCRGKSFAERFGHSRDPSLGLGCDMEQGASGGGWVAQGSLVVAVTSHAHSGQPDLIYGPRFGTAAKRLYTFADRDGFPSVEPIRCGGRLATIIGTERGERIRGTKGRDVIATLGGRDIVSAKGGPDRICLGDGDDVVRAAGGADTIDAGDGADVCDGGGGRDSASGCERTRRIP